MKKEVETRDSSMFDLPEATQHKNGAVNDSEKNQHNFHTFILDVLLVVITGVSRFQQWRHSWAGRVNTVDHWTAFA